MDKYTKAVLVVVALTYSSLTNAFDGSNFREFCRAYEKVRAGVVEISEEEERNALYCVGFVGGLMEAQRQKCLWAKINVMNAFNIEDYWGDAETFAQDGAYSLEHTMNHDPELITRELLIFLDEDPKRWSQAMFANLNGFWIGFLKKYPEKNAKL